VPNKWNFREGDWRLVGIEGNIGLAPEEEQSAEDSYRDGDDAWVKSHDCPSALVTEKIIETREVQ
jgi:hypothetical protein